MKQAIYLFIILLLLLIFISVFGGSITPAAPKSGFENFEGGRIQDSVNKLYMNVMQGFEPDEDVEDEAEDGEEEGYEDGEEEAVEEGYEDGEEEEEADGEGPTEEDFANNFKKDLPYEKFGGALSPAPMPPMPPAAPAMEAFHAGGEYASF